MDALHLLACFVGGALLMNALPHLASGAMGHRFPSPFAKPRGEGLSPPTVNVLWGMANLAGADLLLRATGRFDLGNAGDAAALGLGMLLLGVMLARHFGALNGGRGPGPA